MGKRKLKTVFWVFLLLIVTGLIGCKQKEPEKQQLCHIAMEKADGYQVTDPVRTIKSGSDVSFTVTLDNNWQLLGTDYHGETEIIKDIKGQFRLFMNGVVSQSMREKGLDYKLNFGIELPRLKEIAARYEKNHDVAQALWKENIRECKILAGMLQPVETFYPEIADIWVEDMRYPEIAELTCMTLFQELPYASEKAFEWMADDREYFQLCGFMLMARLLMKGNQLNERAEAEFLDQALTSLQSEELLPQKAAATALRKFAVQSRENSKKINRLLAPIVKSDKPGVAVLASEIKLEAEYWH